MPKMGRTAGALERTAVPLTEGALFRNFAARVAALLALAYLVLLRSPL